MSALKFVCPKCKDTSIEEVVNDCTAYYHIAIDESGNYVDTFDTYTEDGNLRHYQCRKGGHIIKWPDGSPIIDTEELAEYLLEQDYNKE